MMFDNILPAETVLCDNHSAHTALQSTPFSFSFFYDAAIDKEPALDPHTHSRPKCFGDTYAVDKRRHSASKHPLGMIAGDKLFAQTHSKD